MIGDCIKRLDSQQVEPQRRMTTACLRFQAGLNIALSTPDISYSISLNKEREAFDMSIYFPFLAFDFAKFFSCHPYSESAKDASKSYPSTYALCLVSTHTLAIYEIQFYIFRNGISVWQTFDTVSDN